MERERERESDDEASNEALAWASQRAWGSCSSRQGVPE
jgi:hypothetical protein